jgi:hypothetical protein
MVLAGRRGEVLVKSLKKEEEKKRDVSHLELQSGEIIRDVKFLQNETMFAVAQ